MNLKEYNAVCGRLEDFCRYARRRAPKGDPELLERAATLEALLLQEFNDKGDNLALDCIELSGNPVRADLIARYRQNLGVFGQISAFMDDLKGGTVDCPEIMKGRLIWALKGLYTLCSSLSNLCIQEFNKMDPPIPKMGKIYEEIRSNPRALEIAERLRKAGFLDDSYMFRYERNKRNRYQEALVAQALGLAMGCSDWAMVMGNYWGIKPGSLRTRASEANNEDKRNDPKIKMIKSIIDG